MRNKVLLVVGLVLLLQLAWVPASSAAAPGGRGDGGFWRVVRYGESLTSLGYAYGVNPYAICAVNGLANCNFVYAGQALWIPGAYGGGHASCVGYRSVRYGETLYGIAYWYGISAWRLARANGIPNPDRLYAGQTLCIPGSGHAGGGYGYGGYSGGGYGGSGSGY
jgi:hypothetical protein